MISFPKFHDPLLFPSFSSYPLATEESTDPTSQPPPLLGTISEDMTLSTNPTFICKDRTDSPFAVMVKFDGYTSGLPFDVKACKKGYTMCVARARRSGATEGRQGFVKAEVGDVIIIPTSLSRLMEMSDRDELIADSAFDDSFRYCQACEVWKEAQKLARCKGCESVWYCDKECQAKGWTEMRHKTECKVLKVVKDL